MQIEIKRTFELEQVVWIFYFSVDLKEPKLVLNKYMHQKRATKRHKFKTEVNYDSHFIRQCDITLETIQAGSFWKEIVDEAKTKIVRQIWDINMGFEKWEI